MAGGIAATEGERGSSSVCSFMLNTIFSSPKAVICFSLPLLRLRAESSLGDNEAERGSRSDCPSEVAESTLDDRAGISLRLGRGRNTSMAGVMEYWGWASQQKVSRFHNLQLRFSSRLPPSIESAHFENTGSQGQIVCIVPCAANATYQSTFQRDSPHSEGLPCASSLHPR